MDKIQRPPFVTPIEIIRAIASAFDIKNSDDTLDEQALKLDADYRYIDKLIKERIHQPISKYVNPKISNDIFAPFIERVIADNFKNIKNLTGMSGLSRKHALPILLKYIFAKQAASFLWKMTVLFEKAGKYKATFVVQGKELHSMDFTIKLIK